MSARSALPAFPTDVPIVELAAIDLARLIDSDAGEISKLSDAARSLGFFYLRLDTHPEGRALLAEAEGVFEVAKSLAKLPIETREQYRSSDNVWGYKAQKLGDPSANRTFAFNTSVDDLLNDRPLRSVPDLMSQPGHRSCLSASTRIAQSINLLLLSRLEKSLDLPQGSITGLHSNGETGKATSSHLSITITPPPANGDVRKAFNAHTDHGSITMVFHQVLGGLQVLVPDDGETSAHWAYVKPLQGHAIVNLGDVMTLLTNSYFRSNIHRVLDPPGAQAGHTRFSLVYFAYPIDDYAVPIESVAKLGRTKQTSEEMADTSKTIRFKDFISRRLGSGSEEETPYHVKGSLPGVFGARERALLAMAGAD